MADDVVVDGVEARLVREGGFRLVVDVDHAQLGQAGERFGNDLAGEVHAGGVGLHHGSVAVDVHHQTGQEVALTVHQAKGGVILAAQAQGSAQGPRLQQRLVVEVGVDYAVAEREDAHGDGADLEVAHAHDATIGREHAHHLSFLHIGGHGGEGAGEHPRVEALQRRFLTATQSQFGIL